MIQSMSMNQICIVLPQNEDNFPESFKYFNSDKIIKALGVLINVQH